MAITFNPLEGQFDIIVKDHLLFDNIGTNTHSQIDDHLADNSQAHTDYLINNADDVTSGILTMKGMLTNNSTILDLKHIDLTDSYSTGNLEFLTTAVPVIEGDFNYTTGDATSLLTLGVPIMKLSTTFTHGSGFQENISTSSIYEFNVTEVGTITNNYAPVVRVNYTGTKDLNGEGVLRVNGVSNTSSLFMACKTVANNAGNGGATGYRGWGQSAGTGTVLGVEGYAIANANNSAIVAVQGYCDPLGTLADYSKKMAFRGLGGHALISYGSIIATSTARMTPSVVPTTHCNFTSNKGEGYIEELLEVDGIIYADGGITIADAKNIVLQTTTGTKIGTATSQKLGFWNTTPIIQPTTGVGTATFTANSGTAVNDASTFDGYTIKQVVKALRNAGLLA